MSGAAAAVPPGPAAPAAEPALAIAGTAGAGASAATLYTMKPTRPRESAPAKIHAVRSDPPPPGAGPAAGAVPATGRPQRWQKRAWGESSARQPSHWRGTRLAPQVLQNRPAAGLPQTGQEVADGVVMEAGSVTGCAPPVNTLPAAPIPAFFRS